MSLVETTITDSIAHVRLNRPDKHNGMSFPMLDAVLEAAKELRGDRDIRAVVLAGNGPSFCSGLDVKAALGAPVQTALGLATLWSPVANKFQRWSLAWRELGVPVIAAIHGNCFGAGIQLALGCDLRIARADSKISIMESKWGLVPDMGGAVTLRELVRIDIAKELAMTGRVIRGDDAHALGLVTHIDDDPVARATAIAQEIVQRSPDAVGAAKFLLDEAWTPPEELARVTAAERRWQRAIVGRENNRIAIQRGTSKDEAARNKPYARRTI